MDSTVDSALQNDSAYKLALNIGTSSVIQQGKFPNLSGFDYAWMPNLPANSEHLIGFAAYMSAILCAFAPIHPAPGVRGQIVAYDVVTDAQTGISFNYRHWGLAQADRDYEVIECAYGYAAGVSAALKRIVSCDMKLHSVLLGGAILTKPCVCPQVLHGSMRLLGCPEVGATVRGMKPSR